MENLDELNIGVIGLLDELTGFHEKIHGGSVFGLTDTKLNLSEPLFL